MMNLSNLQKRYSLWSRYLRTLFHIEVNTHHRIKEEHNRWSNYTTAAQTLYLRFDMESLLSYLLSIFIKYNSLNKDNFLWI